MQLVVCHTWSEPIHEELHQRQADTTNSVPRPAFCHLQYALLYCIASDEKLGVGLGTMLTFMINIYTWTWVFTGFSITA